MKEALFYLMTVSNRLISTEALTFSEEVTHLDATPS
jgi:hypothetical protein